MQEVQIAQIRSFNRWYTMVIGVLDKHYLNSEFSLTETRILYELHDRPGVLTASKLIELLGLDKGYLSRILQQFGKKRLIEKKRSEDRRSYHLVLSANGRQVFALLDSASQEHTRQLLSRITHSDSIKLVAHMGAIRQILEQANMQNK
jgi:DNA-binding MarR family transcriptional regulator